MTVVAWKAVQKTIFRRRRKLIRQLLSETGLEAQHDLGEFLTYNVTGACVSHWWFDAFETIPASQFDAVVRVNGWDNVERTLGEGKGVIFVFHHIILSHLAWVMTRRRAGAEKMITIGRKWTEPVDAKRSRETVHPDVALKFDFIRQLKRAKEVLADGGFVRILPDGFRGGDFAAVTLPFFARQRSFKTGFADLSMMTGANILPVSVTMNARGNLTVDILEPLRASSESDVKSRTKELVDAYVKFVTTDWQSSRLRFISHPTLTKFLELPRSEA